MTKEKKQKIKKWSLRIGAGFLAFAAGLAATFFLVPNRIRNIIFDEPEIEEVEETHFSKFVTRLMNAIDVDSDEKMEGIVGSIDNLSVEWPDNKVTVNGSLALEMRNLNDFDVTLDLNANYNTKSLDLAIGYTGRAFYLALQDLYIKSSYNSTQDLFEHLNTLFFNPEVDPSEGLGMSVDIDGVLDNLLGGLDLGSLLSGAGGGLGLETNESDFNETTTKVDLSIALSEDNDPIQLALYLNKETNDLIGADLVKVEFGDIKISGKVNIGIFQGHHVYPLDDENYDGYHDFRGKKFIEVVNFKSWFSDIFRLLNEKTIGLDLAFSVDQLDKGNPVNIGQILGQIDIDASKFDIFDYIPKVINADTFRKDDVVTRQVKRGADGEETVVEQILDNINAGIDLQVDRDDEHYADLNLTYAEQNAYFALNEDVIRAKLDVESLNLIIDKVSPLIEGNADDKARKIVRGEPQEQGLFDFVTGSALVTAIKEGHYEGIIDVLESISSSEDGIDLKLNLESLGFGEGATVELSLGATHDGTNGVTSLKCTDIQMAEGIFQLELDTRPYKQENIDKVLNVKDLYQDLDFVTGVFDQVTSILDSKKTGFSIEGSVLGTDNLGMSFAGKGQLDYGEKYGFGDIEIYNHNDPENPTVKSETHPIKVYVDNTSNDVEKNDMKLVYGPNGHLKGKLSVSSLDDILAVVMKVIEKQDRRFMKFLDPILKIVYDSAIGQIITGKDYLRLASSGFIHKIAQNLDGTFLELDLSKDLFAGFVAEDMKIHLNFKYENEVKKLDSIEIINLKLNDTLGNKCINVKITLNDFNPDMPNPVNVEDTFMNFSSLATLVQFGIESTELNCYHLVADVKLNLSVIDIANIKLDFYIEVNGEDTKVYGMFPDIPYIIIASNDSNTDVCSEFLFEPSKHYDINSKDSVGGYFHIIRNEDHHGILNRNFEQYYYRATSKGFVANIADYLLASVLDFRFSLVDQIGKINLDTSSGTAVYEDMFKTNGFVDACRPDDNHYQWDIGMNLDKVSGISALKSLDASLYGSKVTHDGEESCYLNRLNGKLVVQAIVTINLDADIRLVDIVPEAESWASDSTYRAAHERFERVCGVYNNMSDTEKASYDANYLDKPGSAKRIYLDSAMPGLLAAYL